MFDEETNTPAKARTSNLNEELGQIDIIFSDKTGTLTRNEMEFTKVTIGGIAYGTGLTEIAVAKLKREGKPIPEPDPHRFAGADPNFRFNDERLLQAMRSEGSQGKLVRRFMTALSVCHTVYPELKEDGSMHYEASSPDEAALVQAAKNFGFVFNYRTPDAVIVEVLGNDCPFQVSISFILRC